MSSIYIRIQIPYKGRRYVTVERDLTLAFSPFPLFIAQRLYTLAPKRFRIQKKPGHGQKKG
jgi:hypothetical protein